MKTVILFGLVLGALSAAGKVFFAEVGQKVTLECGVNSFSSRLEWSRDKQPILKIFGKSGRNTKGNIPIASRAQRQRETDLGISDVKESDFGEVTCKVDGTPYKHTLVVVSVSAFPSSVLQSGTNATLDCKVSSPGDSIQVSWRRPDGSMHQSQKAELKPVAPSHQGTWQCKVSYDGEDFSKDVNIVVKSPAPVPKPTTPAIKKDRDISNSRNGQNSTGGASDWTGGAPLLGLSWWIWAAIGAAGLVVIILMVVVVVVYKRTKRRKKRFMRMKKAQLSQMPKKYCQCARQTAAAKPRQGRRREKPSALPLQPLLQE